MRKTWFLVICSLILFTVFAYAGERGERSEGAFKPALLVIDIQNAYLPYMAQEDKDYALEMINAAIALFRERDLPVIRVYHTDPKYGPAPDTEAFEFPSSINIEDDDPKIVKNYPSAFKKTDLEKTLRNMECNTLYLCGLSATGCVLATYHGAMERDFDVFMIKNALLSQNSTHTNYIEEIFDAVGYRTLTVMLKYH